MRDKQTEGEIFRQQKGSEFRGRKEMGDAGLKSKEEWKNNVWEKKWEGRDWEWSRERDRECKERDREFKRER